MKTLQQQKGYCFRVEDGHTIHHSARADPSLVVSLALSAPLVATAFRPACHSHASLHLAAAQRSDDSRIDHIAGSARSYPPPDALRLGDRQVLCVAWIGVVLEPGTHGVPRPSTQHEHDQCRHGDERGLEVSLCSLRQDQPVQRQIRNGPAQPLILFLKALQFLQLVRAHSTVFVWQENRPPDAFLNPPALQR